MPYNDPRDDRAAAYESLEGLLTDAGDAVTITRTVDGFTFTTTRVDGYVYESTDLDNAIYEAEADLEP